MNSKIKPSARDKMLINAPLLVIYRDSKRHIVFIKLHDCKWKEVTTDPRNWILRGQEKIRGRMCGRSIPMKDIVEIS